MGVCVGACVWVHVCLCVGKCLLTCMNMLLHLMCIVLWCYVTSFPFLVCLFVCLLSQIHLLLLFCSQQTATREALYFYFLPRRQHYMYWVGIHIQQRTGQCKCKHKPTNQNKRAQYGSFAQPEPLHFHCLPSPLAGVAIRSYNDRISILTQGPSEAFGLWLENYSFDSGRRTFSGVLNVTIFLFPFLIKQYSQKTLKRKFTLMQNRLGYHYRTPCLTCAASSKNRRGVSRYPPSQATTLPFMANRERFNP